MSKPFWIHLSVAAMLMCLGCPVPPIRAPRLDAGPAADGGTSLGASSTSIGSPSGSSAAASEPGVSSSATLGTSSASLAQSASSPASAASTLSSGDSRHATSSAGASSEGASSEGASSGGSSSVPDASGVTDSSSGVSATSGAACRGVTTTFPLLAAPHVTACSVLTPGTNPPTSGPHYPTWAAFKRYFGPVPRGFYLHSMEHGAVVFLYNCPQGCAEDVDRVEAWAAARTADPMCAPPVRLRFIITQDPLLDTRFSAAAWGAHWKSNCVDLDGLSAFVDAHYAQAPENVCASGVDVLDPGSGFPSTCGQTAP